MKILFVLENYLPHIGGVEIVFKNLCEGLAKRGNEVVVLTHHIPGTKREETISGVKVVRVRCLDSRYLFTFTAVPKAVRYAKWADVIHTTTFNGAPPAWLAARIRKKPVLITVHETWIGKWKEYSDFSKTKSFLHDSLERAVFLPRYNTYACVSNATASSLKQVKPKYSNDIITIHNGFESSMWEASYKKESTKKIKELGLKGKFIIFAYGRPGTSKGFQYLIDAYPTIRSKINNATLVLMLSRDKQYAHVVEKMKKDAPEGIVFIDSQPYKDIPIYTHMANCVVVPSITEGFGYTTVESCASGVPVVASNTTSIPEVIYGKHILVAPKDPLAIADGVYSVYKKKYKTTPKKKFLWQNSIRDYETEYKRLILNNNKNKK